MKKVLSLFLIIMLFMVPTVYAVTGCDLTIETSKDQYSKTEQIVVEVKVSNIKSAKGIIALGGTLVYDKNSLTIEKMEGQNGWSSPSYNEENGMFVMDRSSLSKSDETIMKITFNIKQNSSSNVEISIKDITAGDGDGVIDIANTSKTLTIAEPTPTDPTKPTNPTDPTDPTKPSKPTNPTDNTTKQPENGNTTNNNTTSYPIANNTVLNKNDNTTASQRLPHTGEKVGKEIAIIVIGVLVIIFAVRIYRRK